jgi:hypothetical protein
MIINPLKKLILIWGGGATVYVVLGPKISCGGPGSLTQSEKNL